jgi:hypothetical protein
MGVHVCFVGHERERTRHGFLVPASGIPSSVWRVLRVHVAGKLHYETLVLTT